MYAITDAQVFQLTFNLLKDYYTIRSKFPKTEKYTLGERTEETLLAILTAIVEAGHAKKDLKIQPLERALQKMELAKILFRLSAELHCMTERQYLSIEERLQRIGQMLGGWKRSV